MECYEIFPFTFLFHCTECRKGKNCGEKVVTDPRIVQTQFIFNRQLGETFQDLAGKKPAVLSIAWDFSADGYTLTPLVPDVGEQPFKIKQSTGGRESRNRLSKTIISPVTSRAVAGWMR